MNRSGLTIRNLKFNAASVLCARLAVPALNVVLVVGIARVIGFDLLGRYTFLLTLVLLADAAKSMGLQNFVVREVANGNPDAPYYYRSLIRIGLLGSAVSFAVVLAVAGNASPALYLPALIMGSALIPSCVITANEAVFLAVGQANVMAVVAAVENIVRLVASLIIVLGAGGGIMGLAATYLGSRVLAAILGSILLRRYAPDIPPHRSAVTRQLLRSAPEFAGVFVAPVLLFRLDVVLLGLLAGDYYVGIYSAAMRLISVLVLVPDSVMSASYALLSKLSGPEDSAEFERLVDKTIQILALCLTPVTVLLALTAPVLLGILFGAKSEPAAPILQILAWAMIPYSLARAIGDPLVAIGRQRGVAMTILGCTLLSVAEYVFLIRRFSIAGAAIAFAVSCLTLLILLMACQSSGRRKVTDWGRLLRAITPGLLGAGVFFTANKEIRTLAVVVSYLVATVFFMWKDSGRRQVGEAEAGIR